ncbi:hypothetical protein CKA32_000828 [Geitlerinema sp. FC II]|nr:hypothetical protein CKA32_000828 [Geitlerinema sp. FC II]
MDEKHYLCRYYKLAKHIVSQEKEIVTKTNVAFIDNLTRAC